MILEIGGYQDDAPGAGRALCRSHASQGNARIRLIRPFARKHTTNSLKDNF